LAKKECSGDGSGIAAPTLRTNIPVTNMTDEESTLLLRLESKLHERVIGQHSAIEAIARAIRRARVGLKNPNRPIASFFFSGPTGVGKSELAKALANSYFGSEKSMVRLDMARAASASAPNFMELPNAFGMGFGSVN
jgi:ATP-dependent Clp protease ATP-binding subunit ClpA